METLKSIVIIIFASFFTLSCSKDNSKSILSLRDAIIKSDFFKDSIELDVIPITRNIGNVFIDINGDKYFIHDYNYNNKGALRFGKEKRLLGERSDEIVDTILRNRIYTTLRELDDLKILSIESCEKNDIIVFRTSISERSYLRREKKFVLVYFKNKILTSKEVTKENNCLYDFKDTYEKIDDNWVFYRTTVYRDYKMISDFFKRKVFAGYD